MEQHPLAGLEPACVFRFFEEICAIPHGSRNTKAISDYLVRFAQDRGLRFQQDEWNNVVIFQVTWTWFAKKNRTAPLTLSTTAWT